MIKGYRVVVLTTIALALFSGITSDRVYAFGSDRKTAQDSLDEATQHYNQGVDHMDRARQILQNGDSAFAYNYRATSDAKAKKEYEKAVKEFKKAVDMQPTMKEAYNNLGFCYRKLGQLDESLAAYTNALNLDPKFERAREYLGETYLAMDQMDKANEQLSVLKQLQSPFADTLQLSIENYRLNAIGRKIDHPK